MPSVDPPPPPKEKFRGERGGRRVKKQKALQKKVEEGKYVPKVFNPKLKVPGGVDSKRQLCCDSVEAVEVVSDSCVVIRLRLLKLFLVVVLLRISQRLFLPFCQTILFTQNPFHRKLSPVQAVNCARHKFPRKRKLAFHKG